MKKFIYDNNKLRCRLKRTGYKKEIEFQIQKRWFIFWYNCYKPMCVDEGYWGEDPENPRIMKLRYNFGNLLEVYPTGTLNIKKRVLEFFKEYYQYILENKKSKKEFQSL